MDDPHPHGWGQAERGQVDDEPWNIPFGDKFRSAKKNE